jgi:hypothetical protein
VTSAGMTSSDAVARAAVTRLIAATRMAAQVAPFSGSEAAAALPEATPDALCTFAPEPFRRSSVYARLAVLLWGSRGRRFESSRPDKSLEFAGKNSESAKGGGSVASQLPSAGPRQGSGGGYLPSRSMAARRSAAPAWAYRWVISSLECPARTRTASALAPRFMSSEMK